MSIRMILEIALLLIVLVTFFVLWRVGKPDKFTSSSNFGQAFFHLLAAVGIVLTGLWFIAQGEWAPRTAVSVDADVSLLRDAEPRSALIHVAVSLTNTSRLTHNFESIRIAARSYDANKKKADKHGDLIGSDVDAFQVPGALRLRAGETDFTYAELRIPCDQKMVQVLVKIVEPKHPTQDDGKTLVYERKLFVPIAGVCSDAQPMKIKTEFSKEDVTVTSRPRETSIS